MTSELPKTFDPATIEAKWYAHWESSGAFRPSRADAVPYTIVMPPPNVTGSLHIGHALDNTLQDILIRHARLQGKDALWVVGTDHAGIATQMVVERQMALHQDKRTNYSREDFIAKVWEWKAESGGTITQQLRRLGASCDWANERFTMDEGFSKAVIKVFVYLYNQGLLYRDQRLVNWDPGLKTAISDLEVETREVNGKFWHFKYPLEDGSGYISVATTRPETMLADMAVAVNAEDARYTHLIGKNVRLPITGRLIPIIADEHADPELGSGAVKITPGHDFNDFEVGKRAGFKPADMLNMLDAEANVVQCGGIPDEYLGLHRFGQDGVDGAREKVVEAMKALHLLVPYIDRTKYGALSEHDAEPRTIQTPFGDRSGVVIEPWLTDQWYVDAKTLAGPAIEAVRSGAIKVVPKSWEKTYFNWMENIQPWCVSRQLWWGHRIPVWYCPSTEDELSGIKLVGDDDDGPQRYRLRTIHFVCETQDAALDLIASEHGVALDKLHVCANKDEYARHLLEGREKVPVLQDQDVLDTWFSSALWPFGTLGWPDAENPPRNGEVAAGTADGGGLPQMQRLAEAPLHPPSGGSPPRAGEDSKQNLLARHYPNDVLISGFDILFFWDARMIMQGLHFMKEVPWKTLYLHGLVRAADGSKMSKSKGNTVDPLGLIDQYGADALRFTLTAMESQGRDIKLDEKRVEGYRNFATKLWNAARFAQANGIGASASVAAPPAELPVNRWIIGEVVATLGKLDAAIADLRFDAMADTIYHFAWGTFCDWYLELIKPVLNPPRNGEVAAGTADGGVGTVEQNDSAGMADNARPLRPQEGAPPRSGEDLETRAVAAWAFDQILVMLHPFMPFITEELWGAMGTRDYGLIHAKWPEPQCQIDTEAIAEIQWTQALIMQIRATKSDLGVAPAKTVTCFVSKSDDRQFRWLNSNLLSIKKMARLDSISVRTPDGFKELDFTIDGIAISGEDVAEIEGEGKVQLVADGVIASLDFFGTVDLAVERTRLTKAIEAVSNERDALATRLNNPAFIERAKPEAVEKARADHAEKSAEAERLTAALARLG